MNRRTFLLESTAGAAFVAGRRAWPPLPGQATVAPRIHVGYAAITWGGNDPQAIDDIAALGFTGIQLRDAAVKRWGDRPDELKALLAERQLTFVALSSGNLPLDPAKEKDSVALHVSHAKFLRAAGGRYLQIIDERPSGRTPVPDDYRRMGRLLTELGRRTADIGIPLALHNHMGGLSESPDEVRRVLGATDPRFVKLELDIAHYHQAGGKPADAVREHAGRLLFLHIKDVESPVPGGKPGSYRFVELGRGTVDVPGVFAALQAVKFDGWAIVELDDVPDKARTPKESGEIAKRYLEGLGLAPTAR
jgi:inosose dehydratase